MANALYHDLGQVVPDRTRRQLHAVADDVVLVGFERQQLLVALGPFQRRKPALRHGERVVGEVDLLLLLVPLVHRKVDDPAELELVLIDQIQLAADLGARLAGELVELGRIAGGEERRVAHLEAHLLPDGACPLGTDILGNRPGATFLALAPENVAEARLAFRDCPGVHAVAERARLPPPGAGIAHTRALGSFSIMPANTLKPEPRKCSVTSCITMGLRRSGLSEPYFLIASS